MVEENSICLAGAGRFLHLRNCQHGFAKGHCFLRQLVESAAAPVPDLCLNSEPLLSRALESSTQGGGMWQRHSWLQKWMGIILALLAMELVPLRTICVWTCVKASGTLRVLLSPREMCCAAQRFWCPHSDGPLWAHSRDKLRVAENSHLLSDRGEKSWLSEKKACKSPRNWIFPPKKILKSLIQSSLARVFSLRPVKLV